MENPKPGSKALDQHGIALNFEVMLAAITCLFSFTYGTCRCPGWGRVEQGGSPLSAVSAGCRGKGFCAAKFTGGRLTLGVGHCRGWGPNADLQKGLIPPHSPPGAVWDTVLGLFSPASSAQPLQLIRARSLCLETENGHFLLLLNKSKLCWPALTRAPKRSPSIQLQPAGN